MGIRDLFNALLSTPAPTPEPKSLPVRADAWYNATTGLGVSTYDQTTTTTYTIGTDLTRHPELIRRLLRSNALSRKVVGKQVELAWSTGVKYRATSSTGVDVTTQLEDELSRVGAEPNIKRARTLGRSFGGALLLMSIDDGLSPSQPVELSRIRRLLYLRPIDRHDVSQIEYDKTGGARDGEPEFYTISIPGLSAVRVHHTRVIRFDGLEVDRRTKQNLGGWTDTVLQPSYEAIRDFSSGQQSLSAQLQGATQTVYTVKGLHEQILAGNREFIQDWIASVELSRSNLRAVVLDSDGESIDFASRPLGDAVKVSQSLQYAVAAACDMPIVELFGTPPAGLSSDDMSATRRFYDRVEVEEQQGEQGRALDRVLEILTSQSLERELFGASVGYEWPSLYSPTAVEKANINKTKADTLATLISSGVLSPDDVRTVAAELVNIELVEDDRPTDAAIDQEDDEDDRGDAILRLGRSPDIALGRVKNRLKQQAGRLATGAKPIKKSTFLNIVEFALADLPGADVINLKLYISEQFDALSDDLAGFNRKHEGDTEALRRLMRTRATLRADQFERKVEQAKVRADIAATGATMFRWRTREDNRVREEHAEIDGQVFPLATGHPDLGFPGDPPNCRCYAVLVDETRATGDAETFIAPKAVRDSARQALEARAELPPSRRGMTSVGIARARDLANGRQLSLDTLRRMKSYFDRHEVDKSSKAWQEEEWSKGRQAWFGWGGDAGRQWVEGVLADLEERADRRPEIFCREVNPDSTGQVSDEAAGHEKSINGDDLAKTPAKPDERVKGSKKNPEGSASGRRGGIKINAATEKALRRKLDEHLEDYSRDASKKTDLGTLKAVYRRGAGAFSTSHRPGMTRAQWSIARVNAFLYLLQNGKPKNKAYTTDNDLLPKGHPKYSGGDDD